MGDVEGQYLCSNSLLLLWWLLDGLVPLRDPQVGAPHPLFCLNGQLTCTCHMCIGQIKDGDHARVNEQQGQPDTLIIQNPHSVAITTHPICASHAWPASVGMHGGLLQVEHVAAAI